MSPPTTLNDHGGVDHATIVAAEDAAAVDTMDLDPSSSSSSSKTKISFSHIQLYVDNLESLETYKMLEHQLNKLSSSLLKKEQERGTGKTPTISVDDQRKIWQNILQNDGDDESYEKASSSTVGTTGIATTKPAALLLPSANRNQQPQLFVPQKRDIIKQLMVGFGMRVTGFNYTNKYHHHHCNHTTTTTTSAVGEEDDDTTKTTTTSYLVTTKDPDGIQIVVTALVDSRPATPSSSSSVVVARDELPSEEKYDDDSINATNTVATITSHIITTNQNNVMLYRHFQSDNLRRFFRSHNGRQGVAVLAFQVDNIETIYQKYKILHPNLIHSFHVYYNHDDNDDDDDGNDGQSTTTTTTTTKILEVYAYYGQQSWSLDDTTIKSNNDDVSSCSHQPDLGTTIRFVETATAATDGSDSITSTPKRRFCLLPGFTQVDAKFDPSSSPCYFDHWVSNVYSRKEFLSTLHETLGFDTKVDFNAGVVAAGEAQIESTVTGNDSTLQTTDKSEALKDQSQVYLPINNALSPVGHVHGFLKEIGQGIQHVANRVEDLVDFISRCNAFREITGEGFTTLNIPRSYYGILTDHHLVESAAICEELSKLVMDACTSTNIVSSDGAVDLDMSTGQIQKDLDGIMPTLLPKNNDTLRDEYGQMKKQIIEAILNSRYVNIQRLLGSHISEERYLGIVRNKILCDVQGDDVLFQIFTCNILQNRPGDEAPFLEFIQRVCSECEQNGDGGSGCPQPIKPGCGGFGIRNFLTLFLSIEVSKAMMDVSDAKAVGDIRRQMYAKKRVDAFTNQLNESNPILTRISDAMTEEGHCLLKLKHVRNDNDVKYWTDRLKNAREEKESGNQSLMDCSERYQKYMRDIREQMEL